MDIKQIIGTWRFVRSLRDDDSEVPLNITSGYKFDANGSGLRWWINDHSGYQETSLAWKFIEDKLHIETFEEFRPGEGKGLLKRVYGIDMPSPDVLIYIVSHPWEYKRIIRTRDYYERITKLPNSRIGCKTIY